VAAEAEKDSRVTDSTGPNGIAGAYPEAAGRNAPEVSHLREPQPDPEEKKAINLLADLGFEYLPSDKAHLTFRRMRDGRSRPVSPSRRSIPRAQVRMLLGQLGDRIEDHPRVAGLVIPSQGYVELICSRLEPNIAGRALGLDSDELDCVHKEPANVMPSLPYPWREDDGRESVKRIHLSGRNGVPCVELSNASPLAMLLHSRTSEAGRVRLGSPAPQFLATLKLAFDPVADREQLGQQSEAIARSFIYELNVRNHVIAELDARPVAADAAVARRAPEVSGRIRYPRTSLVEEVAILFGFASQASSDPPQAFLSYYQALEYFIPNALQQSAMQEIRRELRDPGFDDSSDASLLRIVEAAARPVAANEPHQLRIVIKEFVRTSRLEEFFDRGWGNHFTGRGPIKHVPYISRNAEQSLSDQVADRVYQIRNRIVHAKKDRRFAPALLPRSTESNALIPDVLLVRLLATEAIAVGGS
jgi:hypothetical protein